MRLFSFCLINAVYKVVCSKAVGYSCFYLGIIALFPLEITAVIFWFLRNKSSYYLENKSVFNEINFNVKF